MNNIHSEKSFTFTALSFKKSIHQNLRQVKFIVNFKVKFES